MHNSVVKRSRFGMCLVVAGLAIVGLTDFLFSNNANTNDTYGIIAGDLLIITAQIVTGIRLA